MCTPGSDRGKGTRRGRGLAGDVRPPAHCCTAGTQRTGVVATSTDLRECPAGRRRLAVRVQPPAHGGAVLPERAGVEGTGADLAERTSRRICLAVRIRPPAHGGGVGPDSASVVRPAAIAVNVPPGAPPLGAPPPEPPPELAPPELPSSARQSFQRLIENGDHDGVPTLSFQIRAPAENEPRSKLTPHAPELHLARGPNPALTCRSPILGFPTPILSLTVADSSADPDTFITPSTQTFDPSW